MPRVIVVGDIVTDIVAVISGPIALASDTAASISITGGGGGANTAAWLAASGTDVTWCGVVGTDDAGDARLAELAAAGVDLATRHDRHAPTGSIVVLAERTERTMLTDRGANLRLSPADIDAALASAPGATHLHLSGYALLDDASRPAARHALATAAGAGLTTSVDAASAEPLRRVGGGTFRGWVRDVDILFANADEAAALVGAAAPAGLARALAAHAGVAVVKLGPAGAVCAGRDSSGMLSCATVDAAPARVRDTTGAGDAFAAGFLSAWIAGARGADALRAGAALGARAVATVGARPSQTGRHPTA